MDNLLANLEAELAQLDASGDGDEDEDCSTDGSGSEEESSSEEEEEDSSAPEEASKSTNSLEEKKEREALERAKQEEAEARQAFAEKRRYSRKQWIQVKSTTPNNDDGSSSISVSHESDSDTNPPIHQPPLQQPINESPTQTPSKALDVSTHSLLSLRSLGQVQYTQDTSNRSSTAQFNKSLSSLRTAKLRYVQGRDQIIHDENNPQWDPNQPQNAPYHHGRTPFGRKPEHREKKKRQNTSTSFWYCWEVILASAILLGVGLLLALPLTRFVTHHAHQRDPNYKFQIAAKTAIAKTNRQIQLIALQMQHLAIHLKREAQLDSQNWPFVTNHNFLQRHATPLLRQDPQHHINSILLAPLVTPTKWRQYKFFVEDAHYDQQELYGITTKTTLLDWDPLLDHYYPNQVNPKSMFVPWQQISRKMDHPSKNGPILLREWYSEDLNYGKMHHLVWASVEQSNTTATTRLLLGKGQDYILHPVIDSVVVKKQFLRPGLREGRVVAVVAAQLQWDRLLQRALETAFAETFNVDSHFISAMANLEDRCSKSTTHFRIPVEKPRTSMIRWNTSNIVVSDVIDLTVRPDSLPIHSTALANCSTGSSWRLHLHPTVEFEVLLFEGMWDVYKIVCTCIVAFIYFSTIVLFRLYEHTFSEEMEELLWRHQLAQEELDPDQVCNSATLIVMDLAGWDEWINDPKQETGRSPSDVAAFMTSLLQSMDQAAAKYRVVKIQSIGGAMVYASGGPDHVNQVVRFARECYGRLSEWKKEWAYTYGSETEKLQFTGGLGNGSLTNTPLMMDGSNSRLVGGAITEALHLEDQSLKYGSGKVFISRSMAEILCHGGKGEWIRTMNEDSSIIWLEFPTTKRRQIGKRGSIKGAMDTSQRNPSAQNFCRRIDANMEQEQTRREEPLTEISGCHSQSHGTLDYKKTDLQAHVKKWRQQQGSPPQLNTVENDLPPPIAEIDVVSISDENVGLNGSSAGDVTSLAELGYEPIEYRSYENEEEYDDEDEDEDGESEDESFNASLEERKLVIEIEQQKERLLDWTVDLLTRCLEEILAARTKHNTKKALSGIEDQLGMGSILDQCKEFISIPMFTQGELCERGSPGSVQLTDAASKQLRDYVTKIAESYRDHAFHNFEHAANVTASIRKLYNKLVGSDLARRLSSNFSLMKDSSGLSLFSSFSLGQSTSYGIKTDPLIKFTLYFCALIHDADHPGVSNAQLILENSPLAAVFKQKSISEQSSIEFAWSLLMRPEYVDLRSAIYCNEKEVRRFRQIIVHCVLATDLFDDEIQTLRKARWAKAFAEDSSIAVAGSKHSKGRRGSYDSSRSKKRSHIPLSKDAVTKPHSMLEALRLAASGASGSLLAKTSRPKDDMNRKGTILLEHLLQAADIAHTMQNWKVFLKWNERLFDEQYEAYEVGRTNVDPSSMWYQDELDFFDAVVLPLASKLAKCGVFEEGGEELLENAVANRQEWEVQGKEILTVYLAHYQETHIHSDEPEASEETIEDKEPSDNGRDERSTGGLSNTSPGSLRRFLERGGAPQKRESNGDLRALTTDEQSRSSNKLDLGHSGTPTNEAGIGVSSVADTVSNYGEDSEENDPDIVFAVLENTEAPDDFYSYILLTPAQKRQWECEEREKDNKSVGTAGTGKRERRRRLRSVTVSSISSTGKEGANRRNSIRVLS